MMRFGASGMVAWLLLLGLLSFPALASADEGPRTHVVARGENLFRIAMRYGVPMSELLRVNGLTNPDRVLAGQALIIPEVKGGQLTAAVAQPASQRAISAVDAVPLGPGQRYLVQPGENLFRIALRYGVSVEAILGANGLTNPNYVQAGQVLLVPNGNGDASAPLAAALPPRPAPSTGAALLAPDFSSAPYFRLTHYCLYGPMASTRYVYSGAVAADKSIFSLGIRLLIDGLEGIFMVEDRFAWDAGELRLDLWVPTCWEAIQRGVQFRRVLVVGD